MSAPSLAIVIPIAVAIGVPALFLFAVRRLDLYASGGFHVVVACFVGGLAAFPLAFAANTVTYRWLAAGAGAGAVALLTVKTVVAPVVEEVLKSVGLVYSVRRPDFTYFVDGAVYGFAAGTAFAILENLFYLSGASAPMAVTVNRAFSTSLMHGSASALVGVSMGRFRFKRGGARAVALVAGWGAAMALHMAFNRLVNSGPMSTAILVGAILIGFAGVAATAGFILWGLRAERAWLREELGLDAAVSASEANVVQRMADINTLLAPIEAHFGAARRREVETYVRLQAQLGLKRKAAGLSQDAKLRQAIEGQIADIERRMDDLRRAIGLYCMSYVRSILPADTEPIWDRLNQALEAAPAPTMDMWRILAGKSASDGVGAAEGGAAPAGPAAEGGVTTGGPTEDAHRTDRG